MKDREGGVNGRSWTPDPISRSSCRGEDGGSWVLRNVSILPHYMASQRRKLRLESWPWRWRQHSPPKRWYPITLHRVNPEDLDVNLHRRESIKSEFSWFSSFSPGRYWNSTL